MAGKKKHPILKVVLGIFVVLVLLGALGSGASKKDSTKAPEPVPVEEAAENPAGEPAEEPAPAEAPAEEPDAVETPAEEPAEEPSLCLTHSHILPHYRNAAQLKNAFPQIIQEGVY